MGGYISYGLKMADKKRDYGIFCPDALYSDHSNFVKTLFLTATRPL